MEFQEKIEEKVQEKLRVDPVTINETQNPLVQSGGTAGERLVGTILDGKIQIESLVGQGGMSVVYKGTHLVLNRPVAVKVILPGLGLNDKAVLRLQQEAKAAFSLSHKNLASVHDVALTSDGLPYLVMDFAGGETLSDMLKRGPLEPMKAIDIFSQIATGLAAAHTQGVIHRDIKPGNIMVEHLAGGEELVKIVDFGIAKKVTENAEEIQKLTQTGEVFGTPLYMSPEQCRGDKLDERSDIYSLGCVLYEALTGASPFKGESSIATIMMHLAKDTPTPDKQFKLPQPLVSVLHRCLEKTGKDRYQSMTDLCHDLQAIKSGGTTAQKYVKNRKGIQRKKMIVGLVLLGALVAACFYVNHEITNRIRGIESGYTTIEECSDKLAKNHNDFKALLERGRLFNGAGEFPKAVADMTDAIAINNKSAAAYLGRAMAYSGVEKYDKALPDCNSALALEPTSWKALHNRSVAYTNLRNYEQALADENTSLKIMPNFAFGYDARACILINLGRYREAVNDCTKAIQLNAKMPKIYTDRANAYNLLGQSEKAIADATEAINQVRFPSAYTARAVAFSKLHQYDKALADADMAIQLQPGGQGAIEAQKVKAQILAQMKGSSAGSAK